jgi:hypothetical protein
MWPGKAGRMADVECQLAFVQADLVAPLSHREQTLGECSPIQQRLPQAELATLQQRRRDMQAPGRALVLNGSTRDEWILWWSDVSVNDG